MMARQLILLATTVVALVVVVVVQAQSDDFSIQETTQAPPSTEATTTTTKKTTTKKPTTKKSVPTTTVGSAARDANVNPCTLDKAVGPCKGMFEMYYYQSSSQTCKVFIWGGCQGNDNRFPTLNECYAACAPGGTPPPNAAPATFAPILSLPGSSSSCQTSNLPDYCKGGPQAGTGLSTIPRFYYDPCTNSCPAFTWAGSGGSSNRYATVDDCMAACGSSDPAVRSLPAVGDCKPCSIGTCNDVRNKTANDYKQISGYMQVFLGMQAHCDGVIASVQFIDKTPRSSKQFYLTIWDINGLDQVQYDPKSNMPNLNPNQVTVTLNSVTAISTNGQNGWQQYTVPRPPAIKTGQYIGLHMPSAQTMNADCVVPYTTTYMAKPTVIVGADQTLIQSAIPILPQSFPLLSVSSFSVENRRPALIANIQTGSIIQPL